MHKLILITLLLVVTTTGLSAQKYFTREGKIAFYSDAPMEKIEAHNNSATAVVDAATGAMEFAVLIKAFQFEKALMQEHFNENYMESSKFPKATFKGKIADASKVNFTKDGTYPVQVQGELTIHGETKQVEAPGTITVKNGQVAAKSEFTVAVADYKIAIPAVVRENIAKEVKITVDTQLQPLKQ